MTSETIQTVATLATLVIIAIGVGIATVELRQEVLARRLQGVSALFSEIWTEDVSRAAFKLLLAEQQPQDGELPTDLREALPPIMAHYNRLGFLLSQGLVKEEEILPYPPFGILAAELFAVYSKHLSQMPAAWGSNFREQAVWWEYLAIRAKHYWESEGRVITGRVGRYEAAPLSLMADWRSVMERRLAI